MNHFIHCLLTTNETHGFKILFSAIYVHFKKYNTYINKSIIWNLNKNINDYCFTFMVCQFEGPYGSNESDTTGGLNNNNGPNNTDGLLYPHGVIVSSCPPWLVWFFKSP